MASIGVISWFDRKGIDEATNGMADMAKKMETTSQKIGKFGKVGFAAVSAFGGGIAAFAIDATSKLEDANVQLENSLKNAGTSMEDQKGKIAKVQAQMEKFGYSNDESAAAIARMTTVTGSADKAFASMGLAADIAKNRHMDLSKAGDLLAKTMSGNMTAAKRMGISIPESIQKIKDPTEKANAIMGILHDRFKGSANAAAGTFAGKMDNVKAQVKDAAANIGEKLVPIVLKLVDKLMAFGKWVSKHKEVMIGIGVAIGGVLLAMAIGWAINTIAAMSFWTAATGGIIIFVALIAMAVAWVVMHWHGIWKKIKHIAKVAWDWVYEHVVEPIKKAFTKAWDAIKHAFKKVWDWLKDHWQDILAIITGPIGLAVKWIKDHWHSITKMFSKAKDKIGDIFTGIGHAIWNGIKWGINKAIDGINILIKGFNKITGIVPGIPDIPLIPKLRAMGGPVTAMSPYIVGERGPELFVPGASGSIVPNHALGGAGGTVIQHITITSNDPQQVVNALIKYQQRNGSVPIKVAS